MVLKFFPREALAAMPALVFGLTRHLRNALQELIWDLARPTEVVGYFFLKFVTSAVAHVHDVLCYNVPTIVAFNPKL